MRTKEEVREVFRYTDGELYWKEQGKRREISKTVGSYNAGGYRQVGFRGKRYLVHRLIWIYHTGEIPKGLMLDHKDGVRDNNVIENLRLSTPSENSCNRKAGSLKKSDLPKNVIKNGTGFDVRIEKEGNKYTQYFKTIKEAAEYADKLREELHGPFARHTK